MTDAEAYKVLGQRAKELTKDLNVQNKMVEIEKSENKDAAINWLYRLAIATLIKE